MSDDQPKQNPNPGLQALKEKAKLFRNHLNAQYRDAVAYTPDTATIPKVSVSKWLTMPEAVSEAMGLPGLPFGAITQVYGKKDSGKTSMLMQGIAECQKQGILPILILSEPKFDFKRLATFMGADPEGLMVLEAESLEMGFKYVEKLLRDIYSGKLTIDVPNPNFDPKKKESKDNMKIVQVVEDISSIPCFIFWDSIGGTLSDSEAEGEVEDWSKDMGRGAQAVKKLVKRSVSLLNKVRDKVGIMFLNQVWTARTPQGVAYDKPAGGEAVQHYYSLEIQMKRGNEVKMTVNKQDMGIGYQIELVVKKNHITHNRLRSDLVAVAEGLISPNELESFKKRYRDFLEEERSQKR